MNPHYTYLLIDTATIFFPFILSFDKKVSFYKQWQYLWFGILISGGFFIIWDIFFTKWHIWSFNSNYITGFTIANLPVEEWLFFVTVPYSCAFIYACLTSYTFFQNTQDSGWPILLAAGIALFITGMIFYEKAYTFSAFCLCGFVCIAMFIYRKKMRSFRADIFLFTFLISLVPFFIVNGLLTAIPVVVYNNKQNLGIRMFTIPFEDTFYGMLLILGTIAGMEWLRDHKKLL